MLDLKDRENIIPVNMALGETKGKEIFCIRQSGKTGHGLIKRAGLEYKDEVRVKMTSLDPFAEENNLKVGLIKADIEGAEQRLLKGAERTIRSQKPALLISIYHTADDFFTIKKMIEEMQLGYSFRIFYPISKNNILLETVLVCEVRD